MSVNYRLILTFSLSMAIVLAVGAGAYLNSVKLVGAADWSEHTRQVIAAMQRILANAADVETGGRGYAITGVDDYLEPFLNGSKQIDKSLQTVRALTADNPTQQQRLDRLEPLVHAQSALVSDVVSNRQKSGFAAAQQIIASGREKKLMDDMRDIIATMIGEEERLLAARTAEAQASASAMKAFAAISAIVGLVVVGCVGFFVTRTISASLRTLVDAITALSSGASEQVAAVTETMSTLEEIKATSGQTLQKSNALGDASVRTREEAQRGLDVVRRSTEAMASVHARVAAIAETSLVLSDQTKQIGEITQVVAKLAQESKMLALNASIEAVKAGEAGKGFSVVASAIRSLAEQSEEATVQVQKILTDVRNATDRAVMATEEGAKQVDQAVQLVEQSGETIGVLNDVVREAEAATQQISLAVQQENLAIEQITNAMADIRTATGQFAGASDMTRSVAQRLTGARKDRFFGLRQAELEPAR